MWLKEKERRKKKTCLKKQQQTPQGSVYILAMLAALGTAASCKLVNWQTLLLRDCKRNSQFWLFS